MDDNLTLRHDQEIAVALVNAIQAGDVQSLKGLLETKPGLAKAKILNERGGSRTPLHIATDWPGHFPNCAATITALVEAGADPNARKTGKGNPETPLQWAASSGDVQAIEALLDCGADIEAAGASIGDGTALDDAVGYGQFDAARRLVERGALLKLWHAAALGMLTVVDGYFNGATSPGANEITEAFWHACHGGQRTTAEYLLARGADVNWIPSWNRNTAIEIAQISNSGRPPTGDLVQWLRQQGAKTAGDLRR